MPNAGSTHPYTPLADQVVFVLVEPQHPGNIGASARAMKNMGLRQLVLVSPAAYDPMRVRWMAPGCDDVIESIRFVDTVEEALAGIHRVVAATARHRKHRQPVIGPAALGQSICNSAPNERTAVLFGREDFGLSRQAVATSERILQIATPEHASLNLAQAVLLTAHHIFEAAQANGFVASGRSVGGRRGQKTTASLKTPTSLDHLADWTAMEPASEALVNLLGQVGYLRSTLPEKVRVSTRQLLQQARPSVRQINALRGMVRRIQWALDNPDADWTAPRARSDRD